VADTAPAVTSPTTTREAVLEAAHDMLARGLVEGTSGNISGRLPDGLVCLTPSSVRYDTMTLDDLVVVDLASGDVVEGTRSPHNREGQPPNDPPGIPRHGRGQPHPRG
jgi:ribulose-5-phosphate 4-epimerase/fuculose-1-phosphate aldolase